MPVFNGQKDLAETLESVLQQTYDDWEMIAIDDGSSDRTPEILAAYGDRDRRVRVVRQDNSGITQALNAGIPHVQGEYVARLDCGDLCAPERFERQVAYLDENTEVIAVGSYAGRFVSRGLPVDVYTPPIEHEDIDRRHIQGYSGGIAHVTAMIRTRVLREGGGYNDDFKYAQDTDLWLRLAEVGQLANIPEVLQHYRVAPQSISSAKRAEQIAFSQEAVRRARARRGLPPLAEMPSRWIPGSATDLLTAWARNALLARNYGTASHCAWKVLTQKPDWLMFRILLRSLLLQAIRRSRMRMLFPAERAKAGDAAGFGQSGENMP
jgi:glycosyltransferase involved in cell wall biosynthesis